VNVPSSEGLVVEGLSAGWAGTPVLDQVSFSIAPGEFVTLMGPNGSGKSTLLRLIAGLETPAAGAISLGGKSLAGVPTHRRRVGLVFQEPTLLPRRTVWENVAYGPQLQRWSDSEVDRTVSELLDLLHLGPLANRPPEALSGGERQRVALARTLAPRPAVVLLDEPFASVDAELRAELRAEFRRVLRDRGAMVLHVTHDREEGLFLGERVLLLLGGRIVQQGDPESVYRAPTTASVARFLGYNVLDREGTLWAVPPTELRWSTTSGEGPRAKVIASGFAGESYVVYLEGTGGERWEARSATPPVFPAPGTTLRLEWTVAVRVLADGPDVPIKDNAPRNVPKST
jgi:putative spermidine/putrescine transport system ATP-binding protein